MARARSSYFARRLLLPAQSFVHTEVSSGIVLLAAAVVALLWANSRWAGSYEALWNTEASLRAGRFVVEHSLRDWVNDALMAVFFFVVGLEVKREFMRGELSDWRRATLPVVSAFGGMIIPAMLYTAFNYSQPTARGWGIPMATDIAFALGVLALLGDRIPSSLRIFLLALATVDDIGAILVIALFYSEPLVPIALVVALVLIAGIVVMQRLGVRTLLYYVPVAVLFWLAVLESGVHATIAGVALGFVTPIRPYLTKQAFSEAVPALVEDAQHASANGDTDQGEAILGEIEELTAATEAPADRLIRLVHPWSSYVVLPLFALANAGVVFSTETIQQALTSPASRGVFVGLVAGKLVGIMLFAFLSVRFGLARLVTGVRWSQMVGVGILGGIGFTVSLFMSDLAFADAAVIAAARIAILAASVVAGLAGYLVLRLVSRRPQDAT
jgi:Na+:H+ antiporter, NhaA family